MMTILVAAGHISVGVLVGVGVMALFRANPRDDESPRLVEIYPDKACYSCENACNREDSIPPAA